MKSYFRFILLGIIIVLGVLLMIALKIYKDTKVIKSTVSFQGIRLEIEARNATRWSNVSTILNVIHQRIADYKDGFENGCAREPIPTNPTKLATGRDSYDIAPCLVPVYLKHLPFDPAAKSAHYISPAEYDTGYNIQRDAISGRITISAPAAELGETISVSR